MNVLNELKSIIEEHRDAELTGDVDEDSPVCWDSARDAYETGVGHGSSLLANGLHTVLQRHEHFAAPATFGLYKITKRSHYDDFGSDCFETLLATASDPQSLKDRWNAKQKEQCLDYGYRHESYFRDIDPPFKEADEIRYNGSTGGGCASVSHVISIQKVPQWDEKT